MPDDRPPWRPAAVAVLAVALAGCGAGTAPGGGSDPDDRLDVMVSFYPLQFVAEQVGGDRVAVTSLVPAGGDAHDVELSGAQVAELEAADVVLHVGGGLQPATDDALEIAPPGLLVDAAEVVELQAGDGAVDPHFWLDPRLLAEVAAAAAAAFAEADPDGAAGYRDRAAGLDDRLLALDDEITATLDGCDGALLVTSHEAFGYLTRRHGLEQVGLTGLDPQVPPSPARVRRVVDLLQDREVSTIFFERAAGPRLTRALAQDLDLRTAVLDPVERTPAAGEDYLSVMDDNREALAAGLVCGG